MSLLFLFSMLGLAAGFAIYDTVIEDDDDDSPNEDERAGDDPTDNGDPGEEDTSPEGSTEPENESTYYGTEGNDSIYSTAGENIDARGGDDYIRIRHDYSSDANDPIVVTGGEGSDVFFIEDPSHRDADRAYDIEITDFDPDEDALRLDLFDLQVGNGHDNLLDLSAEPAADGSYTDLHITMPGLSDNAEQVDITIRLQGLSELDVSSLEIGEFNPRREDDGTLNEEPLLAELGTGDADETSISKDGIVASLDGDDTVTASSDVSAFVMLGDGDDSLVVSRGQTTAMGGSGDDNFFLAHDADRNPDTFQAELYGGKGDDTFVVEDARGDVTLNGGDGDDTLVAHEAIVDDRLVLTGGDGNDSYVFRMGQSVDELASTGDDTYTLVVTDEDLLNSPQATVQWNGSNDNFLIVVSDGLESDLRVEPQPHDPDSGLPYMDRVYVGDTLVMTLQSDDGNLADSGASLRITTTTSWAGSGS
ncbi:hypothetical protein BXY66_0165 [Shimia isoporae]|uniref:Hemolysin type calcium-binding protein n=1 Tax=Shimia isoporae TaxID=647720 RepID=A0A4R1NT55_9RHOB|nr:hypothetical protein [Shimia isoporae]TCL08132.1 hypothetical protein BXY66_0165 [Shimia isoporae]